MKCIGHKEHNLISTKFLEFHFHYLQHPWYNSKTKFPSSSFWKFFCFDCFRESTQDSFCNVRGDCLKQCCGFGMIYSGSGSSFEYLEFRIRIQPILFTYTYLEIITKSTPSIKKKNLSTSCHFLFHTTVQQYTKSRIHKPTMLNTNFLLICSFFFAWKTIIRIRIQAKVPNPCGSGSATLI